MILQHVVLGTSTGGLNLGAMVWILLSLFKMKDVFMHTFMIIFEEILKISVAYNFYTNQGYLPDW